MRPYKHIVQYYETDKMQVTHHSNYLRFMEEARVDFLSQMGWGYDKMEAQGIISPVINISCDYKKSTTFADVIVILIVVLECKGVRLKLGYTMTVGDSVVCTATSTHCFLNTKGELLRYNKEFPDFYSKLLQFKE